MNSKMHKSLTYVEVEHLLGLFGGVTRSLAPWLNYASLAMISDETILKNLQDCYICQGLREKLQCKAKPIKV